MLENLPTNTLPRLLRRTTLSAIAVGVVGFVVAIFIAPPLAALGVALGALWLLLQRTSFGRVVRAGVQNPDMVGALGISLQPYMSAVAALGIGLAGLAGLTHPLESVLCQGLFFTKSSSL